MHEECAKAGYAGWNENEGSRYEKKKSKHNYIQAWIKCLNWCTPRVAWVIATDKNDMNPEGQVQDNVLRQTHQNLEISYFRWDRYIYETVLPSKENGSRIAEAHHFWTGWQESSYYVYKFPV